MKCPNCEGDLAAVKAKKHYSGEVVVDQCTKCGGIWFDPREYWSIHPEEVSRLDQIDEDKLQEDKTLTYETNCPKDGSPFKKFTDPSIPTNIDIEKCLLCGGFWFNKGEFAEYKKHVQKKAESELSPEVSAALSEVFKAQSQSDKYESLSNLSKYLMQDYYRMDDRASSPMGGHLENIIASLPNIIFTILRILYKF